MAKLTNKLAFELALRLNSARTHLRLLFTEEEYEERVEGVRQLIRDIMADLKTDNPLVALRVALMVILKDDDDDNEKLNDAQIKIIWLLAAGYDVVIEAANKKKNKGTSFEEIVSAVNNANS